MGRPTDYTPQLALKICDRLVCGQEGTETEGKPESLRSICRDESMPSITSVMRWLDKHEEFRVQYACARELQQEISHEEIIEIADNSTDDICYLVSEDDSGEGAKPVIKYSAIARAKLQIDTRKWIMSKMSPKKYGEKITNEHIGSVPVTIVDDV